MGMWDWLPWANSQVDDLRHQIDEIEPETRRGEYRCSQCHEVGHNVRTCATVKRLREEVHNLRQALDEQERELQVSQKANAELRAEISRLRGELIDLQTRVGPLAMGAGAWD
jgi:predicted  nucleic acid-binding Zn-ribbon protein